MPTKTAFITGITGQDGAYLSRLLLEDGVQVHGLVRPAAFDRIARLKDFLGADRFAALTLHEGDIIDGAAMTRLVDEIAPQAIYNLAAQTHVHSSFGLAGQTAQVNSQGLLNLLEAIRVLGAAKDTRLFQASTSELFGNAPHSPQTEETPFAPRSPYAVSKLSAYWHVRNYREGHGIWAANGILFNHESPLRGENFVTRKISLGVARIAAGLQDTLSLGNLDAKRDWAHAEDIVKGIRLILGQPSPDDFVLATGRAYSVRDFVERAFASAGYPLEWEGDGIAETGREAQTGRPLVRVDARFFRPLEVNHLVGDAAKARHVLGWRAVTGFETIVSEMVKADLAMAGLNETPAGSLLL